ncbi:MAG TPA: DNA recombination protein RmuC [Nitrospiraceae bacterium]|nr:DNA recombination protein RmuC [Nitrospiraceae bacterium]
MNWIETLGAVAVGVAAGGLLVAVELRWMQARAAKDLTEEMKASFGSLSLDALSKFLEMAKSKLDAERDTGAKDLETKKGLIDQQLRQMTVELEKVSSLVKDLEKDRIEKFGQLASQLKTATEHTAALVQTTATLREALSSTKARGQWGERMAEDVLRLAGFVENVNYVKQKAIAGSGARPDFTFLLPRKLMLNMDVKFPLDNYLKFLDAKSDSERAKYRTDFLRDIKARVKEVTTRDYINPEQNTVDSVLLFIPNEQIYAFIHEQDSAILDDGIRQGVVFCSPLTLFAVLAVIRKAVDNFSLEQTSNEILSLLGDFKKQWGEFQGKLELVGKRIGDAQKEYEALTTTRRRQLEKPLNRIEDLRMQRNLPIASDYETTTPDRRGDDADPPDL